MISASGTAFGCAEPARNTSSEVNCSAAIGTHRRVLVGDFELRGTGGAERLGDAVGIDDHDHRAIAENGIAGEHLDVTQFCRHRLDHDFLGMEHAVDHDAEGLAADLRHHDETVFRIGGDAAVDLQQLLQMHQRQQLVAQPQDRRVLDALDAMFGIGARAHQFDHGELRNRKAVAGGFHDQRGDDGERQRNLDGDAGAFAGHRLHVDGAADLVDIGAHHVHADAAPGHAGHGGRGGEARREDEFVDLRFRHLLQIGLGDEVVRDRLGLDALGVQPAAVVGDADDDVAAFVIGGEPDGALLRLAGGDALGRRFQPVIGGVAHHMGERILDQVEHLAVEFGVGAVHLELDLLAEFAGQIAHDARQLLPGVADRLHPRLHDAFLQLGGDVGEPLQRHLEFGVLVAARDLEQLVARQHQLRHHGHQMFERIDIDADRLVGDPVALRGLRLGKGFFRGRFCGGFWRGFLRRRGGGATSVAVSRNARSRSSSDTSPGRNARSSTWNVSVPCSTAGCARARAELHRRHAALDHRMQRIDQIGVAAFGLGLRRLQAQREFP